MRISVCHIYDEHVNIFIHMYLLIYVCPEQLWKHFYALCLWIGVSIFTYIRLYIKWVCIYVLYVYIILSMHACMHVCTGMRCVCSCRYTSCIMIVLTCIYIFQTCAYMQLYVYIPSYMSVYTCVNMFMSVHMCTLPCICLCMHGHFISVFVTDEKR